MSQNLLDSEIQSRLKKIRLLILDVDGILTDGRIFWIAGQGWTRHFHIKDGYGIKLLQQGGIQVSVMSGSDTADVRARMESLKVQHFFLGNENKLQALDQIVEKTGLSYPQMAYMGDDLFDIPVLERVGFSATVPEALPEVLSQVHYVTRVSGGMGAVREVADAIRHAQGF